MLHFQGLVSRGKASVGLGDINRWGLSSKWRHQSTQSSGVFKVELGEDESSSQLVMENAEAFCWWKKVNNWALGLGAGSVFIHSCRGYLPMLAACIVIMLGPVLRRTECFVGEPKIRDPRVVNHLIFEVVFCKSAGQWSMKWMEKTGRMCSHSVFWCQHPVQKASESSLRLRLKVDEL